MKLYILDCGQMITPDGNILADFNTEQLRLVIHIPAYLIEHPTQGLVLIDTGFNYNHLPDEIKEGTGWSSRKQIAKQIENLGFKYSDVKHVVLSHLHFDHAGQIEDFPNAVFHMRKSEWGAAIPPSRDDYIPADYSMAKDWNFQYIEENEDVDLFEDGCILCLDTKGHSPGHQSFIINLPKTGKMLLTIDAAHLSQYFETDKYYQDAWDVKAAAVSIEKIKKLADECRMVVYGHDPVCWTNLKKAPEYYT